MLFYKFHRKLAEPVEYSNREKYYDKTEYIYLIQGYLKYLGTVGYNIS